MFDVAMTSPWLACCCDAADQRISGSIVLIGPFDRLVRSTSVTAEKSGGRNIGGDDDGETGMALLSILGVTAITASTAISTAAALPVPHPLPSLTDLDPLHAGLAALGLVTAVRLVRMPGRRRR